MPVMNNNHERFGDLKFEELTDSEPYQPEATEKYPDGATAQRVIGPYVVRRYNPRGFWRVYAYQYGTVPVDLQGIYTGVEDVRRAIEAYETANA